VYTILRTHLGGAKIQKKSELSKFMLPEMLPRTFYQILTFLVVLIYQQFEYMVCRILFEIMTDMLYLIYPEEKIIK